MKKNNIFYKKYITANLNSKILHKYFKMNKFMVLLKYFRLAYTIIKLKKEL